MADLDALIRRIAKATGLSDDLAQAVIETAVGYVKTQRPDKAEQIDTALEDDAMTRKVGDMIAKVAPKKQSPEDD